MRRRATQHRITWPEEPVGLPVRAKIDIRQVERPPWTGSRPSSIGCGGYFLLLALGGVLMTLAVGRGEVLYLPLLVIPLIPAVALVVQFNWADRSEARSPVNPLAERAAQLLSRTQKEEFGPEVPGPGEEGWITARGCLLRSGRFFPWSLLVDPEWELAEPGLLRVTLRTHQSKRIERSLTQLLRGWFWILALGPLVGLGIAIFRVFQTGVRLDFIAVAVILGTSLAFLASFWKSARREINNVPGEMQLRISVSASRLSREALNQLLVSQHGK